MPTTRINNLPLEVAGEIMHGNANRHSNNMKNKNKGKYDDMGNRELLEQYVIDVISGLMCDANFPPNLFSEIYYIGKHDIKRHDSGDEILSRMAPREIIKIKIK
jgi:hypothetical protein